MSEIANRQPTDLTFQPASHIPTTAGTVQLQEWAAELDAAHRLGTALCGTDFVPKDFRGKPEAAAAAILAGKSIGLDPMNALSNFFVVHGRPALYARTMAALVMSAGHEVVRTNATPQSVTVQAKRKGSDRWQEFTWTIERAQLAGYVSNAKYKTNPVEMLTAKATAEACRVIAPDVLTGVAAYSVEETELEFLGETTDEPSATKPEQVKRKVTRRKSTAPPPALPEAATQLVPEDEDTVEGADKETGEIPEPDSHDTQSSTNDQDPTGPATAAQIDAVVTALDTAGHTTKAAKQAAIVEALGEQKTATQLTAFEADMLITHFTGQEN